MPTVTWPRGCVIHGLALHHCPAAPGDQYRGWGGGARKSENLNTCLVNRCSNSNILYILYISMCIKRAYHIPRYLIDHMWNVNADSTCDEFSQTSFYWVYH